jgi:ribosomal protein L34E
MTRVRCPKCDVLRSGNFCYRCGERLVVRAIIPSVCTHYVSRLRKCPYCLICGRALEGAA